MNKFNYLTYTRTEMYYDYILPIRETLYNARLSTEDKLIEINKILDLFHKQDKKNKLSNPN